MSAHVTFVGDSMQFLEASYRPGLELSVEIKLRYVTWPEADGRVARLTPIDSGITFHSPVVVLSPENPFGSTIARIAVHAGVTAFARDYRYSVSDDVGPAEWGTVRVRVIDGEPGYWFETQPVTFHVPPGENDENYRTRARYYASGISVGIRRGWESHNLRPPWLKDTYGTAAANAWGVLEMTLDASKISAGSVHDEEVLVRILFGDIDERLLYLPVRVWKTHPPPVVSFAPRVLEFAPSANGAGPPPQMVSVMLKGGGAAPYAVLPRSSTGFLQTQSSETMLPAKTVVRVEAEKLTGPVITGALDVYGGGFPRPVAEIPVVFRPLPGSVQVIPHIADGGDFVTLITLVNPHGTAETVHLHAKKGDGAEWKLDFRGRAPGTAIEIPARGAVTLETLGLPVDAESGWTRLVSARPVTGSVIFRRRLGPDIQESAVPLRRNTPRRFILPFDETGGRQTGLAIANVHETEPAGVEILAVDGGDRPLYAGVLPSLPAGGHQAFLLAEQIPALKHRRGTIEIIAGGGALATVPLHVSPEGVLSSLEGHALYEAAAAGPEVYLLPHIAAGGGFRTTISLTNLEAQLASVRLFGRAAGAGGATSEWAPVFAPGELKINGGATVELTIENTAAAPISGMVRVQSTRKLGGMVRFQRQLPGQLTQAASVPLMKPQSAWLVPFDNSAGVLTAIALANAHESQPAGLTLTARGGSGEVLGTASVVLPASGHRAMALPELLPASAGRAGVLEIQSAGGAAGAIALRFLSGGEFTSVQVTPHSALGTP
ncbi:MAG: hypothetical protein KJZ84_02345 [Bryobacteraceae bacterium]|nr:hypothetical protein [Bryobacteraceae bacterium]